MIPMLLSLVFSAPVTLSLSDPSDTDWVRLPIRVVEVRDLRRLASVDKNGLGVTETGLFEERVPLRTPKPVSEEVRAMISQWGVPDSNAIAVRLELQSLETWPVMATGPDPVRSRVKVRIVSADSSRPGLILAPMVDGENKGFHSAKEQVAMLRQHLREALSMVKPGMRPQPEAGSPDSPALDTAADPRKLVQVDATPLKIHHTLWLGASPTFRTISMSLRYSQHTKPLGAWARDYWGGVQIRAPWNNDDFSEVWAGDLLGGLAWWRRLDDGRSKWSVIGSLGGMIGTETYQRTHVRGLGEETQWVYGGVEARGGVRTDRTNGLVAEGGMFLSARVPSAIRWFDPGLYFQMGYRL
ncbi:MAG TPA: hypothetical protein PKO15_00455 [Fibrobacteria bacterium]|nr:hypothetical protein [Fibrobacteria bacterium]HOX50413.1 hypothetical protein [Fibrobacteria bacterium]